MQWEEESLLEASVWGEACGAWGHPRSWLTTNIGRAWGWGRRWRTQGENPPETHCSVLSRSPSFPAETCRGQKPWLGERGGEKRGTLVRGMANKVERSAQSSLVASCHAPVSKTSWGDSERVRSRSCLRAVSEGLRRNCYFNFQCRYKVKNQTCFWMSGWLESCNIRSIHPLYIYAYVMCIYNVCVCEYLI